ncbi:TonB-dependent receptor [uncultured Algibacter sp.]|uniref:TonB-dependent receptor n=1 Tax=uncultured Algibacter sp. TaxID=298659 RepID=UPI0026263425|nr:TonB-dependent receptor [uncultured Algibacter sp.]
MKTFFLFLVCSFTFCVFSQSKDFKISGTVISEEEKSPLESATVYLERIKDSTLVTYTITDRDGRFSLENKTTNNELRLLISYVGYQTYLKTIKVNQSEIDLDSIKMQIDANGLDAVLVKSRAPITIKKDTLEFNVKSFKTKKNANVEDLLKLLPGVEVDEEGKIKVNGKDVNKILVNGKPFFGNDPTITTRNLTKDIIEKVQVLDTKTKAEAFSGEEGDDDSKTINLTIKEENNKGVFGRASAGGGTNKIYEYAGMFNRFDNDQRISVLVGGNNHNSPGFSFGEIRKMYGGANSVRFNSDGSFQIDGRSFGGGEGITTSKNAGVNFADEFGKGVDISTDYFYSGSDSENKSTTQRENILPNSRFFTDSESNSFNSNDSHSANLEFDIEIDSTLLINIEPSLRYSKNRTDFFRKESSNDPDNILTNDSETKSVVETFGRNFSNEIDITKKLGSKGAYVKFSVENEIISRDREDFLNSETNVYGINPENIVRDQYTNGKNESNNFNTRVNYNVPLIAKKFFLNFEYRYSRNKQEDNQSTFELDTNNEYTVFNPELSTDFEYINEVQKPAISLNFRNKKWSARFKTSYVFRTLENNDFLRPGTSINRRFEAIELRSRFSYRFSPKSSLYASYRLNNNPPQLSQLQLFKNVSNPLNTLVGNPNLSPVNSHWFYAGYNAYDFQKRTGFNSWLNGSIDNNQVVSNTTIDENFVRTTTYANVDGNYRLSGGFNYSNNVKIDTLRTIKVGVGVYSNLNRIINFNNGIKYSSNVKSLSPNINFLFTWKDVLEFRPRYSISFTKNSYNLDSFQNREFLFHSLKLSTATFIPKNFEWRNEINFTYNPNIADGFQKSAWFWNSTLAYSFMKDKAALTLKAYDLLNQNTNARRIATENYIQDSQSTVLQQYFMLSFSWKFNSLGQKGEINDRGFHRF